MAVRGAQLTYGARRVPPIATYSRKIQGIPPFRIPGLIVDPPDGISYRQNVPLTTKASLCASNANSPPKRISPGPLGFWQSPKETRPSTIFIVLSLYFWPSEVQDRCANRHGCSNHWWWALKADMVARPLVEILVLNLPAVIDS